MLLSNCTVCGMKKSTFIKNKEIRNFNNISNEQFKINKTINKFLLNGDKVIPELNLKQPLIVLVDHLLNILKDRERIQKFRETGNLKHIYIYIELFQTRLALLIMQHILIVKLRELRELFQKRF